MIHVVDGSGGALRVPDDLDAFAIRVASVAERDRVAVRFERTFSLAATGGEAAGRGLSLPQTLAVVPADVDAPGTVRVDVLGLRNGRTMQRIHRVTAFGVGRVDLPPFALTPLCFGVVCPPDQTCEVDGVCRAAMGTPDGGAPPADAGPCGLGALSCGDSCVVEDESNCGGCGVACATDERCIAGTCGCGVGLARCDGECVDLTSDAAHCGACAEACSLPGATSRCEGGSCAIDFCDAGVDDCNGIASDGCETALGTAGDCAACGDSCSFPHADGRCEGGTCALGRCRAGWDDCNGSPGDGCETALGEDGNCTSCGDRCRRPHAVGSCTGLACQIDACEAGWGDCNGTAGDGCETELGTTDHCTSCGDACPTNELCGPAGCYCTRSSWDRNDAGECVPSCGHLLNMRDAVRGGTSCCLRGCATTVVGGPGETFDCPWCCEAEPGTSGCS